MWRPPTDDLYALLGVPPDANRATIQRAWRKRMRHVHPDSRPEHEKDQAHHEAARLNDALHILTDRSKRLDYDLCRRQSAAGATSSKNGSGSARPRPESSPPPRPPRVVVVEPQVVDFGSVVVGEIPPDQVVTVCFSDGSTIRYAWVLKDRGDFWQVVEPQPYRDVSAVTLRLRARPAAHDGLGPRQDRLRLMVDDLIVMVPVCITVVAPAPPPPPPRPTPPRRPAPPRPTPPRRPAPPPQKPPAPRLTLETWRNFRLTCLGLLLLLSLLLLLGAILFSGIYALLHAAP